MLTIVSNITALYNRNKMTFWAVADRQILPKHDCIYSLFNTLPPTANLQTLHFKYLLNKYS